MAKLQLLVVRKLLAKHVAAARDMSLEQMRENVDKTARRMPALLGVTYEPTELAGMRAEWSRPRHADPARALLFVHGGGYQLGSLDSHRDLCGRIARAARAPALAIAYRRAPEATFPAALDDVVAAYRELTREHGFAAAKLAIVGDSAGGNLALGAALRIRASGDLEMPGALVCMSPWTDLTCSAPSLSFGGDPTVDAGYVREMARSYLGGQDPKTPEASPLFADVRGLPPILLQVGGKDALLDDSLHFAAHCKAAGVDVTLEIWDEMFHAFQVWAAVLRDAKRAIRRAGEFVREKTGGSLKSE
jgi:monoterpene epsilon-lactone hydrolase